MTDSTKSFKSIVPKGVIAIVLVLAIIGFGVLGIVRYNSPIPAVKVSSAEKNIVLPGQLSVTFPDQGESAVGTDNFGVIASSSDQTAIPIASVTKIMTAYIILKAHPLKPGEEGPSLTMTAEDVAGYELARKNNYSLVPVKLGEQLSERQLLEGLLLPSGNNIADSLGRWVAGSDEAFVAKMNETAQSLNMTNTHYADASGANEATVSNATDQIKIALEAMQDPVFREIVAMPQVILPVAGKVFNVNNMLGKHDIVGIKTGSGTIAGGCFVSAVPIINGTEKHYIVVAVLGSRKANENLQSALETNVQILDQVRPQFRTFTLTPPANGYGQISTSWHTNSDLEVTKPIQVFGYPGMEVAYSINPLTMNLPAAPGTDAATLKIKTEAVSQNVPMTNTAKIDPPGFSWRLLRN